MKLIEVWFPVKEISRDAGIEMSYKSAPAYIKHAKELGISKKITRDFFDPKIRNLHPWFARRPCSTARATTLAAILPENVAREKFFEAIGWNEKKRVFIEHNYPPLLFYVEPKKELIKSLLGGRNAVVCDPMAGGGAIPFESLRMGFKTIAIDYNPVAYLILKATVEYPAKFGSKLAKNVREEAKKLIAYAEKNLKVFYPENAEGYIFARGFKCPDCEGIIPLIHDSEIASRSYIGFHFDRKSKTFTPYLSKMVTELPHIVAGMIECPYCGQRTRKVEAYRSWTENHVRVLDDILKGDIEEEEILATHLILIRQTKKGYSLAYEEDAKAFIAACRQLSEFADVKSYIPLGEIPAENEVFEPVKSYGIKHWYQLFNPRQLLSLCILIKYLNERIEALDSDELMNATMLYLALGVSRVVDYNSIVTTWKKGTIRDTVGQYARNRKISYAESYCEAIVPGRNLKWIFETDASNRTQGGIIPILNEICRCLEGLGDQVRVIFGDARKLSSYVSEKLDLINVDPPYFDTHIYSDISEYFWQVLRLSLQNSRFIFDEIKIDWGPKSQTVPREGELIVRKSRSQNDAWYAEQMMEFFKEAYKTLKDDGVLLVWFTHKTLNAWKAVISALYGSNFCITRIWPVTTELLTRLVAKNSEVLDKTLIIVARKKESAKVAGIELQSYALRLARGIMEALCEVGATKSELKTFLYAAIISAVTAMPSQQADPIDYCYSELIPKAISVASKIVPQLEKEFESRKSGYFSDSELISD